MEPGLRFTLSTDQTEMRLPFNTQYTPRAVDPLCYIYLAYDWTTNDE